ncbi:MAG: serine--tRNA ligase, partial [Ruminococcus sp.]|nr:serine--tRNA ligase [Ruminococcus sp.]
MIDIKLIRTNPEIVKENIKKKFQYEKLALVDKVIEFDEQCRKAKAEGDDLRNQKNKKSKEFGKYNGILSKSEDENLKAEAQENISRLTAEIEKI